MSFFKDFKDDFSDAVDEMSDDKTDAKKKASAGSIDDSNIDVDSELSKLDGLLEKVSKKVDAPDEKPADSAHKVTPAELLGGSASESETKTSSISDILGGTSKAAAEEAQAAPVSEPAPAPKETTTMDYTAPASDALDTLNTRQSASDENAVITSGMTITGDLDSTGSISVEGTINGNVRCNGKLTVTGAINGNSQTSEFVADQARIQGEVVSNGTVKIGVGSVIIGNVSAASAVIAGAVKGDIDVQGPVVVDTSAVVMGNIKSKSVQINNGAIIEGFCSQAYADVDVSAVFGDEAQ
ncbi:MAG: polymer-forming cytoskeletal protein [Lachnospiraceae bacterium]|nr:polymer-forming cytoskeletal protein [Lachnospiraceae bacterium]